MKKKKKRRRQNQQHQSTRGRKSVLRALAILFTSTKVRWYNCYFSNGLVTTWGHSEQPQQHQQPQLHRNWKKLNRGGHNFFFFFFSSCLCSCLALAVLHHTAAAAALCSINLLIVLSKCCCCCCCQSAQTLSLVALYGHWLTDWEVNTEEKWAVRMKQ